jgi:hypothetical protein
MTLCFRRQPSDPAAFRSRLSVSARRKEVFTRIDRVQKSCGKIESVITRFEDLTQSEQAAITKGRVESGKRPIPGYPLPTAYANAPNPFVSTITAQNFTPHKASAFAQEVEAAIAVRLGKKRFTKPSTPEGEPSTFAEALKKAVDRRRKPQSATQESVQTVNWRRV